jgi:hypothetical protein
MRVLGAFVIFITLLAMLGAWAKRETQTAGAPSDP